MYTVDLMGDRRSGQPTYFGGAKEKLARACSALSPLQAMNRRNAQIHVGDTGTALDQAGIPVCTAVALLLI